MHAPNPTPAIADEWSITRDQWLCNRTQLETFCDHCQVHSQLSSNLLTLRDVPLKFSIFSRPRAALATRMPGFTLIEMMIVVALIAILAAIALPSYNDYIRRGQQPEAFNALSDFRAKMEQYYQDNRKYGSGTTCANDATASSWNRFAATKYFNYACTITDGAQQAYSITATGKDGQVKNDVYSIDQNGNRSTSKFKGATVSAECWLTRSSAC